MKPKEMLDGIYLKNQKLNRIVTGLNAYYLVGYLTEGEYERQIDKAFILFQEYIAQILRRSDDRNDNIPHGGLSKCPERGQI